VEDRSREFVAAFSSIRLGERAAPFRFVIHIGEAVDRLINTSDFSHLLSQLGGPVVDAKSPHDRNCLDQAELQRAGESKQIVPVLSDQIRIDAMACDTIQVAIVG
jgi:hypothetical protein